MSDASVTWVIVLVAFVSYILASLVLRRRKTPLDLRPIAAYSSIPRMVDAAIESDERLHLSFGSAAIGKISTVTALSAAEITSAVAHRLAFEKRLPLITLSDPISLALASDTLRKAYLARDNASAFRAGAAVWYPDGERSLTFAAGAASHAADMHVVSHLLMGDFGAELALLADTSLRRDTDLIANSVQLEGQAVAYVMSEKPLIGEELFAGGAYLNPTQTLNTAGLVTQDVLRWVVIVFGILLAIVINAVD